jgi:hypothetical protein
VELILGSAQHSLINDFSSTIAVISVQWGRARAVQRPLGPSGTWDVFFFEAAGQSYRLHRKIR